jgi:peptide methionine sulfoxide reductase MsrB
MQCGKSQAAIDRLTAEQRRISQESGTERPCTREHSEHKELGIYVDIVSGKTLFASSDKFEFVSLRFIHRDDMESEGYGEYVDQVEEV